MTFSADGFVASVFCLIIIPLKADDEPENLLSQSTQFCLIGPDAGQSIGSTNIDERALRLNDEANLNFYDERFSKKQIELFQADLKRSGEYTLSQWEHRTLSEKLLVV